MITQFSKIILILLLVLLALPGIYAIDTSDDRNETTLNEFNTQKVHLIKRNPYSEELSGLYKIQYIPVRGNGLEITMSELALEMNNPVLAQQFKWGSLYHTMVTGLALSITATSILDVIGISMLLSRMYMEDNSNTPPVILNNMLVSGIVLFAVSSISIGGIITFAILTAKAYSNYFNISQAQLFIRQYNNFLRKRLGVPISMDLGYNSHESAVSMMIKIKL